MSAKKTELVNVARDIMSTTWRRTNGSVVPETETITLRDGARDIDAVFLYADLAGSSDLVKWHYDGYVASIIKCYVSIASRLITHNGGAIRSFDGDRVMGIFMGDGAENRAVRTAFHIQYMVRFYLESMVKSKLEGTWQLHHGVGIARGEAMMVRAGVRGHNDLLAIGEAPNIAAKLSEIRQQPFSTYIEEDVWGPLRYDLCFYDDKGTTKSRWSSGESLTIATGYSVAYRQSWWWEEP